MPEESLDMQSLLAVGTSAGGRQPKAIVAFNRETREIRSGQIEGLKNFDYCLLKFGTKERSTAELEMVYYEMATRAGISMMPCWLMAVEGEKHFVTKRFDREHGRKLHMQTLAALYPEADSYESLLWVCRKMRLSERASAVFALEADPVNVLANNTDDHNKNFSFLMDESGRWSLAPAYDMTYTFSVGGYLPETQHCLLVKGKYTDITLHDVLELAADNGIRKADTIIADVVEALRSFRTLAEKNGVQERWTSAVETTLLHNLEMWGFCSPKTLEPYTDTNGRHVENFRIEQQYKGNYHLLATIDGTERKAVIRAKTAEHDEISRHGVPNLDDDYLKRLVDKFLKA